MSSQEVAARTLLIQMQVRLANGPYAALGVPQTATAAEIRSAFLELTKTFHPARFGRMAAEIQKMSNEIFLSLRAAHDSIAKPAAAAGRPAGRAGSTTSIPATKAVTRPFGVPITPTTRPGVPSTGKLPADPPTQPPQRQTQPLPTTKPAAPVMTGRQPPSPSSAPANRPSGRVPTPASGVPTRPTPPSSTGSGKTPAPVITNPNRTSHASTGTSPIRFPGAPATPRPTNPTPAQPIAATRLPGSSSSGTTLDRELAPILELMGMGMWDAAQAAVDSLAAKNPENKRYNALACYARGRRAQLEGNLRIAQIELNDALKLDPDLEPAKTAVAELYARRK